MRCVYDIHICKNNYTYMHCLYNIIDTHMRCVYNLNHFRSKIKLQSVALCTSLRSSGFFYAVVNTFVFYRFAVLTGGHGGVLGPARWPSPGGRAAG